jgi:hypothetical protein
MQYYFDAKENGEGCSIYEKQMAEMEREFGTCCDIEKRKVSYKQLEIAPLRS